MTRAELIERLEAAPEGSRELDAEVALAVGWEAESNPDLYYAVQFCPPFSISVDAVRAALPQKWGWIVGDDGEAVLLDAEQGIFDVKSKAATPPLALCAAWVKSLGEE